MHLDPSLREQTTLYNNLCQMILQYIASACMTMHLGTDVCMLQSTLVLPCLTNNYYSKRKSVERWSMQ